MAFGDSSGSNITMSFGKPPSIGVPHYSQPSSWMASEPPSREYMLSPINGLLQQNNQLKSAMASQRQLISSLKEQLQQHHAELQNLNSSKKEIAACVEHVSQYNKSYLELLRRKDKEIVRLKQELSSVRGHSKDQTQTTATARNTESRHSYLPPSKQQPSPYDNNYNAISPRESRRSNSLLKDVKRFVRSVKQRLNSPSKPCFSPRQFNI